MHRILKDLLQNNNSFLLIPNPLKPLAVYYNLYALYTGLSNSNTSDLIVDTYIDRTKFSDSIQKAKGIGDLSTININDRNKIIVTQKDLKSDIDGVEWKKTEQGIKLTINTIDPAPAGVKLQYKNSSYDKIILLDFDTQDEIDLLTKQNSELLNEDNLIILSNNQSLINKNRLYTNDNSSMGQQVYSFMKEFQIPINKTAASYLIAGIYQGTNNLVTNINAYTFKALADLSNQNVDLNFMIALANDKLQQIDIPTNTKIKHNTTNNYDDKNAHNQIVTEKQNLQQKPIIKIPVSTKPKIKSQDLTQQIIETNTDPLSPATNIPEPIRFKKEKEVIHPNTPLPVAS